MDEYISKTELLRVINTDIAEAHNERCVQLLNAILYATTADVVPKSEVDEIVRQWKEEANCWQDNYIAELRANEQIKSEVAREIFEEIESKKMFLKDCVGNMGVVVLFKDISELKKKYTEEKE